MKALRISRNLYLVSHAGRRFALLAESSADAIVKFIERQLMPRKARQHALAHQG